MTVPRLRRLVAALALCAAAVIIPVPPAAAAPASAADPDGLSVLFVLDVSGSMARTLPRSSQTLLQVAKGAFETVTASLPSQAKVGLRTYGATYGGNDPERACADTRLEVPVEPLDRDALVAATQPLRPTGETPIGRSLVASGGDFTEPDDARVLVLISDGEDTCAGRAPSPCQAARSLQRTPGKVRIEAVGFSLQGNQAAIDELRCVARVSGGKYYAADDAQALAAALERIADATLSRLGKGAPVSGSLFPENAPPVGEGSWRDSLLPGQTKWYRFEVAAGQRPVVLATIEGVDLRGVPRYGRNCPAWEAQLFNPFGEGGNYPPYGNANVFDGTQIAATGVRSAERASEVSDGIDYAGSWTLGLSLAAETLAGCSAHLPARESFDVQFSLELLGEPLPAPTPTPEPVATPEPPEDPAAKFTADVERPTPPWVYPAVAVGLLLAVGGAIAAVLRHRRLHYR